MCMAMLSRLATLPCLFILAAIIMSAVASAFILVNYSYHREPPKSQQFQQEMTNPFVHQYVYCA